MPIAKQIAEALEAAHEAGVIHRDLKPANIKVRDDGTVKVLDFGLAKALDPTPEGDPSQSPTLTAAATQMGVIMGTAAYMSPEQAAGQTADKRSDIWSFGVVLYEMLTGQRLFTGETVSHVLAAVLRADPAWNSLSEQTPAALRTLLRRCLERDALQRLRDIGDARLELGEMSSKTPAVRGRADKNWSWKLAWLATGGAAVAGWIVAITNWSPTDVAGGASMATHFSIQLTGEQRIATDIDVPMFDMSADGSRLAWIGPAQPTRRIFTRSMNSLEIQPIPGTEGVGNYAFAISPDGSQVCFVRDGALWRLPVEGGIPVRLLEGENPTSIWGGDWGENDWIVVSQANSGLVRLRAQGGDPETLTTLDPSTETAHWSPWFLPGGEALLFAVGGRNGWDGESSHVELLSLDSGERKVLLHKTIRAQYLPSGHLLFGRGDTVYAVPFDLTAGELTGPESPVLADVARDDFGYLSQFSVSNEGTLVYIPEHGSGDRRLGWLTPDDSVEILDIAAGRYSHPRISPGGGRLAIDVLDGTLRRIAFYDFGSGVLERLRQAGSFSEAPVWNRAGSRLVFASNQEDWTDLFHTATDSDEPHRRLTSKPLAMHRPLDWSPDGAYVLYEERLRNDQFDLYVLPVEEADAEPTAVAATDANESQARFSPDGAWIAYVSDEEGTPEVFLVDFNLAGGESARRRKVSRQGGWQPTWSADGRKLFYRSDDGRRLLSVAVRTEPILEIGEETVLFDDLSMPFPDWFSGWHYDITPSGERFLTLLASETSDTMAVVVVQNWTEELERLVPTP